MKNCARRCIFSLSAMLACAMSFPTTAQGVDIGATPTSAILTSTATVLGGVAIPRDMARPGADEQLDLGGRLRIGSLRLSALISTRFAAGFGAAARWASFTGAQTLRWSWPAWSAAAAAPDLLAVLEVKEMAATVSGEVPGSSLGFKAELGKFPLKWGVGKAFRPSDIFKTMDYSALIPQAGGTPAARLSVYPSALSSVEAAAAVDGQGAVAAGARYLSALDAFGAFAASVGWRRAAAGTDEIAASIEGQLDVGIFSPYTEISARHSASADYIYAMVGSGASIGSLTFYAEGQGTLGLSTPDLRVFGLARWALSDLTSISIPFYWLNEARTASGGTLVQLEGILGGKLDLAASGAVFFAYAPPQAVWSLSASWTRSLSVPRSLSTY